ncbi:zf-CCHC domain-containing protein [Tanacetum coccineum]
MSLKALDEGYSIKNYVRKFLRALHTKWRSKVTAIKESKDLTSLSLDELIRNLKFHEMVIKKDSKIVKAKGERKCLALKAKRESSNEESLTFGSEDEEYAMMVRDFKKFFKRRGRFVRQPQNDKDTLQIIQDDKNGKSDRKCFRCKDSYHLIGDCPKPLRDKNQRAFVRGSWSDSGKEDDEKAIDETCLMAQASSELMAVPKIHLSVFHVWMPLVFTSVSDEDANHKFLRSLPPAWDSLAMTMRTKKNIDTLSIDDLYNNLSPLQASQAKPNHNSGSYSSYTTSSSKATPTATPGLADEVIHSFLATNADDVDLIHEDLDQIDDLDLEEMDINWQIAMTAIKIKKFYKKTGRRPRVDGKMHVAFDKRKVECFNCHNTGHFARECKFKGSKEGSRQEASRGQDFKPVRTEKEALMTIDEGQINWVEQTTDEEINHALMAFTVNNEVSMCSKLCLDSYNALKAKYDELQSEFGDQEAALTAHKIGLKKVEAQLRASHKQQISLNEKLHFQANQIFEKDEKLKKYRRIGMKAVKDKDALQKIVDSWFASSKNLWKLIDCGISSTVKLGLGYSIKSNAEVLSYEEEMDRGIFASIRETDPGYHDIPLFSRFKQVEYKGVPPPLSGDYTPRAQEDIDDSLYVYGKHGPQPQSPSPTETNASSIVFSICPFNDSDGELGTVSNANSTVYSTCQSNDSDGEQGTVSDHSVNDDSIPVPSSEQVSISTQKTQPQVPKPQPTVDPSCAQHVKTPRQPIRTPVTPSPIPSYNRQNWNQRMERDLGAGYSFQRKPCFVCGSLSHLIKNCDYYEKKMAREAALKSKRVVHTNDRQATPAWNNTNRINKANQFTPRPVNVRPNLSTASNTIKTGRVNGNTGHGNVNSDSVHVNAGTQVKSGTSRFNTGKQHVNSGSVYVNSVTQIKSAASRVNTGKRYINSGCVHINTARVNRPVSNKPSPKPSQVKFNSQNKYFSKQSSPANRPFSRNTAYKSNIYAVKGKMGTAVKTSAGAKELTNPEQTATGAKGLTSPEQTATGKGISNPLMAVMVCQKPYGIQLTNVSRVNTPGSDENRLKLYDLMYKIVKVADTMVKD